MHRAGDYFFDRARGAGFRPHRRRRVLSQWCVLERIRAAINGRSRSRPARDGCERLGAAFVDWLILKKLVTKVFAHKVAVCPPCRPDCC